MVVVGGGGGGGVDDGLAWAGCVGLRGRHHQLVRRELLHRMIGFATLVPDAHLSARSLL